MAWIKYFDASPAFFMAVNGQMAFPNAAAAQDGTRKFAQTIRKIELKWGDDLHVDPLTNEFAIVAVSWREIQVNSAAHSITETGYFTGLAEYREGHWQFRHAHWSAPVPSRQFLANLQNRPCIAGAAFETPSKWPVELVVDSYQTIFTSMRLFRTRHPHPEARQSQVRELAIIAPLLL